MQRGLVEQPYLTIAAKPPPHRVLGRCTRQGRRHRFESIRVQGMYAIDLVDIQRDIQWLTAQHQQSGWPPATLSLRSDTTSRAVRSGCLHASVGNT